MANRTHWPSTGAPSAAVSREAGAAASREAGAAASHEAGAAMPRSGDAVAMPRDTDSEMVRIQIVYILFLIDSAFIIIIDISSKTLF